MELLINAEFLFSALRSAAPLILAAVAALYCERSGVIQIGLEGLMLFGAFSAASVAFYSSGVYGMFAAGFVGLGVGCFYGLLCITLRVDQIIAGTVVNMIAWGGIPIISRALFDSSAATPNLDITARLNSMTPIYLAILVIIGTHFLLSKTQAGLWLTFAGEKPEALTAAGIRPAYIRWGAILVGCVISSVGGACLSLCLSSCYTRNMTAGRGFMALAALILGKWRPWPVLFSCLLFGFCEVVQMKLQGKSLPIIGVIPNQLVQMAPYLLTLVLLAGLIGESRPPARLGRYP